MMFGTREEFSYLECRSCGCLQLQNVPDDFAPYYPKSYYSFQNPHAPPLPPRHKLAYRELRSLLLLRGVDLRNIDASLRRKPIEPTSEWLHWSVWLRGLSTRSSILDVGCGNGQLLLDRQRQGFRKLTGLDPYIAEDLRHGDALSIRRELPPHSGPFDFIMLNHSLEHMSGHVDALLSLRKLLSTRGRILIRIPVADSYAFRHYGRYWVALDAPRHQYIHTVASLKLTAERAGLSVTSVRYDSLSFQFWGSEQYRRGIPLMDERSYGINAGGSVFSDDEIGEYKERARLLNSQGEGDSAGFLLERLPSAGTL
jgi:SAM-dependent methyltransferase